MRRGPPIDDARTPGDEELQTFDSLVPLLLLAHFLPSPPFFLISNPRSFFSVPIAWN